MKALLHDEKEIPISSHGQHWMTSWHAPGKEPSGKKHGAAGLCITSAGEIVVISTDNHSWDFPAGRPEGNEDWEQTLRREMLEEACAVVTHARLLGFSRGRCVGGTETGLVLVRSIWRADVELLEWKPEFEIHFRKTISVSEARQLVLPAAAPIWDRAFHEAGVG